MGSQLDQTGEGLPFRLTKNQRSLMFDAYKT